MTASVIYLKNALCPQKRRIEHVKPCTIRSRDPKWELPYIALVNGSPVLRGDWDKPIHQGDILAFVDVNAIPQGGGGGGGSNPLQMVAMIAVMVFAPYAAGLMGFTAGTVAFSAASMAIGMVGMALVNALLPPPTAQTSPQQNNSLAAPSPTYNIQAQGNSARLEAAIPEHFGRHIAYPDFAAQPYVEYSANEQYLYQLLCIGRGEYSVEAIRIEDTPIANFPEVEYEIVPPGQEVALFPANVITSVEVAGQTMATGVYVGPFVANPAGTGANYIGIDWVAPKGLYYANDGGGLSEVSCTFQIEGRFIDDYGAPTGTPVSGWFIMGTPTVFGATTTPRRYTLRCTVPGYVGRLEIRVKRLDAENTGSRYGHEIVWAGLRAYLPGSRLFGDVTLLAVRMKATNSLSQQASRKINVIATRKLPIWNGATWSANTATRSPAWPIAYACKQVGLTDAQIDLATLLTLDGVWAGRGDYFDGRFDNFLPFWEAITKMAGSGRAKPFLQGGVMRIMRDQAATIPVALFSMRNIAKGSFTVDYLMPTVDTADAIDVGYFDALVWKPRRVRAKLTGSTAERPVKMELFGITGRDHAFREGMYQAGCNRYRRKIIKFTTEMEGFIPSFGDLVAIQHDMPAWGQCGEVIDWDAFAGIATLSEPPTWGSGTHYIVFRKRDGSVDGPFAVTAGPQADQVALVTVPVTPYTGGNEERTHYSFGWAETYRQPARILSVKPAGLYSVQIEALNEDSNVHTVETGVSTPVAETSQLAGYINAPVVTGLQVLPMPFAPDKMLISWNPAPWADYYVIEQSSDGINWTSTGETNNSNFTATAVYRADTRVRVAGQGMTLGPWAQATITATPLPSDVTTLTATVESDGILLSWMATTDPYFLEYEIRQGGTDWATATPIGRERTTQRKLPPQLVGDYIWRVKKVDDTGQLSLNDKTVNFSIAAPSAPTGLRAQVIDNNVLLYWAAGTSQQSIDTYRITRDTTFVGTKSGLFTSLFETVAGSFIYKLEAVDIAGNVGAPATIAATVSQPPDYVLKASVDSTFNGTLSNADYTAGTIVLPVNTTETFAQHFTNNGWATPDAQIAAGYPIFAQPAVASGYYEETIDYGQVLAANIITVTLNAVVLSGSPVSSVTISTKKLVGDAWTDFVGFDSVFANDFQYIKVRVSVTAGTHDLLELKGLNIRIDAKLKSDAGNIACVSTDNSAAINSAGAGGTVVLFNVPFNSVTSINISAQGTTQYIVPLYDFVGATLNPIGFKVYLYDYNGNRTSANISWTVKGY